MSASKFVPFKETDPYIEEPHTLASTFADDGYLFFRNLLDKERVKTVRNSIINVLKEHGFVNKNVNSKRNV